MPKLTDYLSPVAAIDMARKALPAFKYAIGVAGLVGIVAVIAHWGLSAYAAVFGSILLLILMVLLLVFARAATLARRSVELPAQLLIWAGLSIAIVTAVLLLTSVFYDRPLPLRTVLVQDIMPSGQKDLAKVNCEPPSRDSDLPTTLTFVNHRAHTVQLFWIRTDGSIESFPTLSTGQSIVEDTYVDHSWCIKDRDTLTPVAFAIATKTPGTVDIR